MGTASSLSLSSSLPGTGNSNLDGAVNLLRQQVADIKRQRKVIEALPLNEDRRKAALHQFDLLIDSVNQRITRLRKDFAKANSGNDDQVVEQMAKDQGAQNESNKADGSDKTQSDKAKDAKPTDSVQSKPAEAATPAEAASEQQAPAKPLSSDDVELSPYGQLVDVYA